MTDIITALKNVVTSEMDRIVVLHEMLSKEKKPADRNALEKEIISSYRLASVSLGALAGLNVINKQLERNTAKGPTP